MIIEMIEALEKSDQPYAKAFALWVRNGLKRDLEHITNLTVCREIVEQPPVKAGDLRLWKAYKPGDRWFFFVVFADGYSDMLHVDNEGRQLGERPAWYYDHHGVTPLRM